jgi:hypothetical protein
LLYTEPDQYGDGHKHTFRVKFVQRERNIQRDYTTQPDQENEDMSKQA